MGYKIKRKLYQFEFPEEHDLHGLVIRATALSLVEWENLRTFNDVESSVWEVNAKEFEAFISHVADWNLEDEDGAVLPVSSGSLMQLERRHAVEVVREWITTSLGFGLPESLGKDSGTTATTDLSLPSVESIPTETL